MADENNTTPENKVDVSTGLRLPPQILPLNKSLKLPTQNNSEVFRSLDNLFNQQFNTTASDIGTVQSRTYNTEIPNINSTPIRHSSSTNNTTIANAQTLQLTPVRESAFQNTYRVDLTPLLRTVKKNSLPDTNSVKDFLAANPPNIKVKGYTISNVRVEFDEKNNYSPSIRFNATPNLSQRIDAGITLRNSRTPFASTNVYAMLEFKATFGGPQPTQWTLGGRVGVQSGNREAFAFGNISNPTPVSNPTIEGVSISIPQNYQTQQQIQSTNTHTVRP
jgi:hypothetical protein